MADGRIIIDTQIDSDGAEKGLEKLGGIAKNGLSGIVGAVSKVSGAITTVMGSIGIVYNSQMEQYMASFETMLGSSEAAVAHVDSLKKFAASTPFEMGDLAQASKTLMAFGINVKDIEPNLKMLGDISLGNKDKFNSLSLVFGQVASQGKLMGGDLLQMINAGFNPLLIISQKTGKSMTELKDEMSQGKISFEMVSDAMKTATSEGGMFAGAMEKQSKTMGGLISTLKDNLGALAGKVTKPLFDMVKNALESFLPLLDKVSVAVDNMFAMLDEGKSITFAFYNAFKSVFGEEIAVTISDFIGVIEFSIKGLVAFIKGDTDKARDCFYTMFPVDDIKNEFFVDIIMGVLDKIKQLFNFVKDNSQEIIGAILGVAAAIGTFNLILKGAAIIGTVTTLLDAYRAGTLMATLAQMELNVAMLANPFTWIAIAIAALVGGIIYLWTTNEGFRNAIIGIWESIKSAGEACWGWLVKFFTEDIPNAWNSVVQFFLGIPQWFSDLITSIKQRFIDGWTAIWAWLSTAVNSYIDGLVAFWSTLPEKIGYCLGYVLGTIAQWGLDVWNFITVTIPAIISDIVKYFSELPGKIQAWLLQSIADIVAWGTNIYNTSVEWVNNTIDSIISYFSELPGRIWSWLCETVDNIINWGSNMYSSGVKAATDLVDSIINTVSSLPSQFMDIGENIVRGVWEGITGMAGWIGDKVSGFFGGLVDGARSALKINSPSRVFRDKIGKSIPEGVAVGVDKGMPEVERTIKDNFSNLVNEVNVQDLTAQMTATVNYETSKTAQGANNGVVRELVSQNNYNTINNSSNSSNASIGDNIDKINSLVKALVSRPIEIVTQLNSRVLASELVEPMSEELGWLMKRTRY